MNELVEENKRSRQAGGRGGAERGDPDGTAAAGRGEGGPGVQGGAGRGGAHARTAGWWRGRRAAKSGLKEYLTGFVAENPEFLPARIAGGTGMTATQKAPQGGHEQRGPGQDSTRYEHGGDGARAAGDRAGGRADSGDGVEAGGEGPSMRGD